MSDLGADVRAWVEAETGATVVRTRRLGSGASRRTWSVGLDDGRTVVVREDPGTGPVAGTPLTLAREARVYRALAGTSVPVPTLLAAMPDGRALLFDLVAGTDDLASASDEERRAIACDYAHCLARLHHLPTADVDLGADGSDPARADIALWRSILDTRCGPRPTTVSAPALAWLAEHVPDSHGPAALCHGDAGPGNFLHHGGAVSALLDWEFAHLGDPHDDLAWVAVRNQLLGRPLSLDAVHAAWREESGSGLALGLLEYYRALVLVRMAISCDAALNWTGGETTPETRVQAALRPFLAAAVLEALRRAGCVEPFVNELDGPARAQWEGSHVAAVLGDPRDLDELGAVV